MSTTTPTPKAVADELAVTHGASGIAPGTWLAGVVYHARRNADPGMTRPETAHAGKRFTEARETVTAAHGPRGADQWDALCARAVVDAGITPDPLAGITAADVRRAFT